MPAGGAAVLARRQPEERPSYPGSWPYRAWDSRPLPGRCSSGPVPAGRGAAVALTGLPPAVATTPGCLVTQEFVHGADLGVVAGEGELGQAPGILDGPQHGVVGVGGAADEVTRPAGVDHHRGHQRAAVQAAAPAGADVRAALGRHR